MYLKNGEGTIDLKEIKEEFSVAWFNPRNGEQQPQKKLKRVSRNSKIILKNPKSDTSLDWVILIKKE